MRLSARGRNDRLFHRHAGEPSRDIQVGIRAALVTKRSTGQARHSSDVSRREGNLKAVRGGVGESVNAVSPEVVVLPLLAIGDDRRAGFLEEPNGVADGGVVEPIQCGVGGRGSRNRLKQLERSRNAADRLGGNRHFRNLYLVSAVRSDFDQPSVVAGHSVPNAPPRRPTPGLYDAI